MLAEEFGFGILVIVTGAIGIRACWLVGEGVRVGDFTILGLVGSLLVSIGVVGVLLVGGALQDSVAELAASGAVLLFNGAGAILVMRQRSRMASEAASNLAAATARGQAFVDCIRSSEQWRRAAAWGEPRPGHPEGTIGRHVEEQVLPFIDSHFRDLPEYWDLVALAYMHDIGKPDVDYRDGRIHGESHSVLSLRIAAALGASQRLQNVIRHNDRAYSHWRKLLRKGRDWDAERWTEQRRTAFVEEFGSDEVDLRLLVLFHRADNAYRRADELDESVDPVFWFENRLVEEGLLDALPPEGKDQRLDWQPAD